MLDRCFGFQPWHSANKALDRSFNSRRLRRSHRPELSPHGGEPLAAENQNEHCDGKFAVYSPLPSLVRSGCPRERRFPTAQSPGHRRNRSRGSTVENLANAEVHQSCQTGPGFDSPQTAELDTTRDIVLNQDSTQRRRLVLDLLETRGSSAEVFSRTMPY